MTHEKKAKYRFIPVPDYSRLSEADYQRPRRLEFTLLRRVIARVSEAGNIIRYRVTLAGLNRAQCPRDS